jgi:hypothetical protein
MSTQNNKRKLDDAYGPTFDLGLDMMTEVFSHVQCVRTRHSLARVSKLWRDASKPAAAYPLTFDLDAFPDMDEQTRLTSVLRLLDNDEALSLPYERVVGLLGEAAGEYAINVCLYAASRGSVRLLKWTRENNLDWSADTCHQAAHYGHLSALQYLHENGCPWNSNTCLFAATKGHLPVLQYLHENGCPWNQYTCIFAAQNGHLPVLKYLHENGCPWDEETCFLAADNKQWDCLQYAVDNKCPMWEKYAKEYAEHLR